ncbi:SufD family Fe-S cluster assembly protein [Candidatus Woesearchaeota archaeon]|nr:SufD family Fe-S cluster assembly protein [Candidatus Woesearchaeota archaeon]
MKKDITISRAMYDDADEHKARFTAKPGINEEIVRVISKTKNEPEWMLEKRLKGLKLFQETAIPTWGPDLSSLNLNNIVYFVDPNTKETQNWDNVPPEIKKTFDRLGIPEAEKKALAGVGAQYDCLTEDAIVYTNPKGGVKIKDLKKNDFVFSLNEETNEIIRAKVNGVMDKGVRPIFEIKIRGKKIKTTYNHPFLTLVDKRKEGRKRARYQKEWKYLNELKEKDIIAIATDLPDFGSSFKFQPINYTKYGKGKNQFGARYKLPIEYKYKKVNFPEKSNLELMWLFGFFLGDGYITKAKNSEKMRVNFAAYEGAPEIRTKIKKIIESHFGYKITTEDKFKQTINSTKIALFFKKQGWEGSSHTKSLPQWVYSIPKEEKIALIAGYIDSDGTVRKKEKDIVITSVNMKLLEQIKELCVYCGLDTANITNFTGENNKIAHRLQITGGTIKIPCVHKIKKERLESRKSGFGKHNSLSGTTIRKYCSNTVGFSRIESIKYIGKEHVYDIEVKKHHNFIANGFVVHNSSIVYHSLQKALQEKGVIFENMDVAVQKYPELVKKYFMTNCIPIHDHKFIMLHAAVWSGGTFIYVPKGVIVELPLQAYFRMNAQKGGQFEHTLIIVDEGAELHYIEGCFTKGNLVTTNPDFKPIEEIKKGERVLTDDGTYKRITKVYAQPYKGIIKKITLTGDPMYPIEVTDDHPFLYADKKYENERNKQWKIRWNIPQFFKKGDYLAIPINKTIISQNQKIVEIDKWTGKKKGFIKVKKSIPSTKEFFELAGLYLAEGSISGGYYVNFSFGEHERSLINHTKELIEQVFGLKAIETKHPKNHGINVVICSVELVRIFKFFGNNSKTKQIPEWLMFEDPKKQSHLIKGHLYGDGNYFNKISTKTNALKEVFRHSTSSPKLALQLRDILLRLKIPAFLNKRDRSKEKRPPCYTVGISGDHMIAYGKMVGVPIAQKLNGKARGSRIGITKDFAFFPIRSIESRKVENEIVYNFAVDKNETYCVSRVAVHNCSSPSYSENSLHAGCVELHVLPNARMRYSSIENWSKNVFNLNTKRALVHKNAVVEWVNGNTGSARTMLYPSSVLIGEGARSESLGIAFAGPGQDQDTGAKAIHIAPNTSSIIKAKSISRAGGVSSYRGLVHITESAKDAKATVRCDALIIDDESVSKTYPYMKVNNNTAEVSHEATVGKIGEEEIFYLMSRGLSEEQAVQLIVNGFIEPIVKALPLEYALELNKLIELEMEGI